MVKLKTKTQSLQTKNRADFEANIKMLGPDAEYTAMLQVIADVLDLAAQGQDAFVTIGSTRDKSSVTFTIAVEGERNTYYDVDLLGLCIALKSAL